MCAAQENQISGCGEVRVNAICPGMVLTGMSAPHMDKFRQILVSGQKYVRLGVPAGKSASDCQRDARPVRLRILFLDVANVAMFLASGKRLAVTRSNQDGLQDQQ